MDIGRKVYADAFTGEILAVIPERAGSVRETTQEEDFASYIGLQGRNPESVICIQLEYGQDADKFASCYEYRVDPTTRQIVFNFIPPQATLDEAKSAKKQEIELAANDALTAGFDCQPFGDGITHHYSYDTVAQTRLHKFFSVQNSPLAQAEIKWSTAKGVLLTHTAEQFMKVCGAAFQHESKIDNLQTYIESLVEPCETLDDVGVIKWDVNTVIP